MALQNGAITAPAPSPERGRTAAFGALGAIRGIGIRLASPDQIRSRSSGEVTRAATIHYQSRKPEEGGLFCERIFGPSKDWTCSCGKYQRRRTPGFRCERCGVEIAPASVRRERLGHIELISPVVHPWFLSYQQPSIISLLLDLSPSTLAAILRAQVYLVLSVDEAQRERLCAQGHATSLPELLRSLKPGAILEEQDYRTLCSTLPGVCEVATGALALQQALKALDVEALSRALQEASKQASEAERKRLYKRLDVVEAFRSSGVKPSWMVLSVIPVLPADLRPILELKSGRLASSDLNVLYERLLHRNQRIKQLQSVDAPRIILQHEQRLLQEAAEALIDNGHRARPWKGPQGQPLRSLTDILSGKGGRFRHNLLGKRVDYSGRSVICAGLDLRLHQCGLPKKIAIELFKPFIMRKLLLYNYATSLHTAKRMVERRHPLIFDVLEECLHERYVLLNRAPTLHRLGIQAFEAKLVEGDAIRLHPLVCSAFNADFDGDQMAVHLPLSEDAQDEAKSLLLSTHNLRSSADSSPAIVVSQEMVLGLYYLSQERPSEKSAYRRFASEEEALLALEHRVIDLHTPLQVRFASHTHIYETPHEAHCLADLAARQQGPGSQRHPLLTTTAGRLLINQVLPPELGYRNYAMTKDCLKLLVSECLARCGEDVTARVAEQLKNLGFRYATRSGISFAMSDMKNPGPIQERIETLKRTTAHQQKELDEQVRAGILSPLEREQQVITLWEQATAKISQVCQEGLDPWGSLSTITASGATKAKFQQIRQLNGIRGLLADPAGRIIPVPILSNYLEGMRSWEVFIAARGARKGFMNRSLDTAISGYLTRKLVECGQDVWITCEDCGGNETLSIPGAELQALEIGELRLRLLGRVLGRDLPQCCLQAGAILGEEDIASLMQAGVEAVNVRSPLTCQAPYGLCQQCYGWDLAKRQLVARETLVGVIAGQSIGEPGTQLTMRTFHSGGIAHAQGDITMGLPRVNELFEARLPHPCAPLALEAGTVHLLSSAVDAQRTLTLVPAGRTCLPPEQGHRYHIPAGMPLLVRPSQWVERGTLLADGPLNLKELLRLQGKEAAARYLIREVQLVYRVAGVSIHDKHLEVIVRQLLRYGQVLTSTTPQWPLGSLVDTYQVQAWNLAHGASCTLRPQILGLSRAALQTPSWLGAASFQETARVLADAAIRARIDPLRGPKERIILGLPIPTPNPPPVVQRK